MPVNILKKPRRQSETKSRATLKTDSGQWLPYEGPEGGEGWQLMSDPDEVRYQQLPPGDTPDSVPFDYWGQQSRGQSALRGYLLDTGDLSGDAITEAHEYVVHGARNTPLNPDDFAERILAEVQNFAHRRNLDPSEFEDEKITRFIQNKTESIIDEHEFYAGLDGVERRVYEYTDGTDLSHKFAMSGVKNAVDRVSSSTSLTETEVKREIAETIEEKPDHAVVPFLESGINDDWPEKRIEEWENNTEPINLIELPDKYSSFDDVPDDDLRSVAFDSGVLEIRYKTHDFDTEETFDNEMEKILSFVDSEESNVDTGEFINRFNDRVDDVLSPFGDLDSPVSDEFDPRNAKGELSPIKEVLDDTGRSSRSMWVAEDVPDQDGNERDLFITNTSHDRRRGSQDDEDAQRQVAGTAAFREAGFSSPQAEHCLGEFWVVEEAPGDTADEFSLSEIEDGYEQLTKLGAVAMITGTWDIHEGNVFVNPDTDEIFPVDMDLAGNELHYRADGRDNTFGAEQYGYMGAWGRLRRLFENMDGDKEHNFGDLKSDVKRKTKELENIGKAGEIISAMTQHLDMSKTVQVEENLIKLRNGNFYENEPPSRGGEIEDLKGVFDE